MHGIGVKVKSKKEVVLEAQREEKKVHFATLMDICHIKKEESEPTVRSIVKDDSGANAVVAEQGAFASQLTASKSNGCHWKSSRL